MPGEQLTGLQKVLFGCFDRLCRSEWVAVIRVNLGDLEHVRIAVFVRRWVTSTSFDPSKIRMMSENSMWRIAPPYGRNSKPRSLVFWARIVEAHDLISVYFEVSSIFWKNYLRGPIFERSIIIPSAFSINSCIKYLQSGGSLSRRSGIRTLAVLPISAL